MFILKFIRFLPRHLINTKIYLLTPLLPKPTYISLNDATPMIKMMVYQRNWRFMHPQFYLDLNVKPFRSRKHSPKQKGLFDFASLFFYSIFGAANGPTIELQIMDGKKIAARVSVSYSHWLGTELWIMGSSENSDSGVEWIVTPRYKQIQLSRQWLI